MDIYKLVEVVRVADGAQCKVSETELAQNPKLYKTEAEPEPAPVSDESDYVDITALSAKDAIELVSEEEDPLAVDVYRTDEENGKARNTVLAAIYQREAELTIDVDG